MADDAALVLFSGGQDSAVCLAWALDKYPRVETVGFNYGQRHVAELSVREKLRRSFRRAKAGRGPHASGPITCWSCRSSGASATRR